MLASGRKPEPGSVFTFLLAAALALALGAHADQVLFFNRFILDNPNPQANARFGQSVASTGDVNGDAVPDLLVGAPNQDVDGNTNQGQAFLFSGADGSLLATLDNPNPQASAFFGFSVAGVGDTNGDSAPDLLVGAPGQDVDGKTNQGQAFLFSGADRSLLATLNNPTPQADAVFATSVAAAGDTNGDSAPDLLVGAPRQDVGANSNQGQAFLFVSLLALPAAVDINPGSDPNAIHLNRQGQVSVGVLTTDVFDASTIDISTVKFGPAGAEEAHARLHLQDLNRDGLDDAVFHFNTQETGILAGDEEACIRGTTTDGQSFFGCDDIATIE